MKAGKRKALSDWVKQPAGPGASLAMLLALPVVALSGPPLQTGGHGHGAGDDPMAIGLSWSVLFMMSMPYVLIGIAGAVWWRHRHRERYDRLRRQISSSVGRSWMVALPAFLVAAVSIFMIAQRDQAIRDEVAAIQTLKQYVRAIYPRDYSAAYPLISMSDRHVKSEEEYVRENDPLTGFGLEIGRMLAARIEFRDLQLEIEGNQATIHVTLVGPDGDDPVLNDALFAHTATGVPMSEARKQAVKARVGGLIDSGELPTFDSKQTFTLVREQGTWRVSLGWGRGIAVRLSGSVAEGLPWEFGPVQPVILAQPGKTYRAVFRARNLTGTRIVGKATRRIGPKDGSSYFHDLQCFCMIQAALRPREAKEMELVFRLDQAIPPQVREFDVSYVFYPIDKFPANATEE
jgi:hypothetical protein